MVKNLLDSVVITTLFAISKEDDPCKQHHRDVILRTLKKILPADFFECKDVDALTCHRQKDLLKQMTPLITHSNIHGFPGTLSFFALSKYRSHIFKFFFEMITRWLTPGRRLNVVLVYATDFRLMPNSEEIYSLCKVMISVANQAQYEEIQSNFPIIETEIALGIQSRFYAQKLMQVKGVAADDKTALIQEFIAFLIERFPNHYDHDVFTEMQHVLVTCREDFKVARQARHLSRIISIQYLFRKDLREELKQNARRRYFHLKIFRALVQTSEGPKRVLSVLVGVNFLRDQENFGEDNLIKAIQHYIPSARPVENSFFVHHHKHSFENICLAYVEVEKQEGTSFTSAEIRKLRRELPSNLKNRVEYRVHTVFMPRNEEEVMRNILTLTNQIKYVRDIPQVSIIFDEQAHAHLYFTVILARLLKPESHPIADLFKQSNSIAEYLHDRTKVMGHVRKKYTKEATVFRLKLPKECFLRADNSIDLYKARQMVVNELLRVVGEIRDYNGGMISKQNELLSAIREALSDTKDYDELLLDNFFYSLSPVVIRTLVDPLAFKTLFLMFLAGLKKYPSEGCYLDFQSDPNHIFALIIVEDVAIKEQIKRAVQDLNIPSTELAYASVKMHGYSCFGYICSAHDPQQKENFFQTIEHVLKSCENTRVVNQ